MKRARVALLERLDHANIPPGAHVRALRPAAQQVVSIARALSHDVTAADHGRAVGDPRRRRGRDAVRRRPAPQGRGRRRHLHLPPPRRDPAHRRPRHRPLRRAHRRHRPARPTPPQDVLVEHMVGRKVDQLYPAALGRDRRRDARRCAASRARRWSRRRASRSARARSSASAAWSAPGAPSCCGSIYGLDKPDTGEVHVDGKRLPAGKPAAAIAAGLGLAPEDRKSQGLLLDWSLTKNVTLADLGRFRRGPLLDGGGERSAAGEQLRALKTVPDDAGPDRPRALGRQPAEGRARALAAAPVQGAAARRAHARRRRRRQGRDLQVIADLAARGPRRRGRRPRSCPSWPGSAPACS